MPNEKMAEAKKVGDDFYKGSFSRRIRPTARAIQIITVIIVILEIIDEVPIIMEFHQGTLFDLIFSTIEVIAPVILGVIIFSLIKELEKWEDTYKRVKKLID